jgi:hypothetical protein
MDIFSDDEDTKSVRRVIWTLNQALTVSIILALTSTTYFGTVI